MRAAGNRVVAKDADIHLRRTTHKIAALMQTIVGSLIHTFRADEPTNNWCRLFCSTVQHICSYRERAVIVIGNCSAQRFSRYAGTRLRHRDVQRNRRLIRPNVHTFHAAEGAAAEPGSIVVVAVGAFHQIHNKVLLK